LAGRNWELPWAENGAHIPKFWKLAPPMEKWREVPIPNLKEKSHYGKASQPEGKQQSPELVSGKWPKPNGLTQWVHNRL